MDTAKRILYGIVGGIYLLYVLMFVFGTVMVMWFASSSDIELRNGPLVPSTIVLVWLSTGIILLTTCVLRNRWLTKPKRAVIPFAFGCVLVALSLLPWFFGPPYRFGAYHVIGLCCFASLAHDTWTCIRRAKRLNGSYGQTGIGDRGRPPLLVDVGDRMNTPPVILPRVITYEWSRDLSRAAARRAFGPRFRTSLIVLSVVCVACVAGLIFDQRKDQSGGYWALLTVCLLLIMLFVRVYFKTTRSFEELPDKHITVRIETENITFETSDSVSTLKWSAIKRLQKFPDVLLLFRYKTRQSYTPLPVASLGAEAVRAIEDMVREHGGQVT